jgi:hypothetical protein
VTLLSRIRDRSTLALCDRGLLTSAAPQVLALDNEQVFADFADGGLLPCDCIS